MSKKVNPIDKDKIAENAGLLPYASHIGSAIIKPIESGKIKGLGMKAMYEQTDRNLNRIKEQVELLINQAQEIHDRIKFSEQIYQAECSIFPIINNSYYLYERTDSTQFLSMVSPVEWGSKSDLVFICAAKLLADHTWEIIEISKKKKADGQS
jgi:hypothetical protein